MEEYVANTVYTHDEPLKALGYQQLTLTPTVVSALSATVPDGATQVLISIETADVRMRLDGVNPTATVGHAVTVGTFLTLALDSFASVKFYSSGAAVINMSFLKARA